MARITVLLAAATVLGLSAPVCAKPVQSTKYSYYSVAGKSAVAIYDAMIRKGPRVNGAKAYASTSATTTQDGRLLQTNSCKVQDYRLKLDFVIRLPKIKNEKVLPVSDRKRWKQFSAFLKAHEETHREIWLGCAADLERQVKSIRASTCAEADRKASQLWEKMRASCNKKHNAFDAAEQKKLMKHPFVQLVYRKTTQQHSAAAQ